MAKICIYFQVHQPDRLRKYTYFDIENRHDYEDTEANHKILQKVAQKCYLPTNALLLKLLKRYGGDFKVAFSLTGVFIEQCKRFCPEVLDSFKRLAETGCVEFLNETYYHSLSFLFSKEEFKQQVLLHKKLIEKEFGYTATTFRNTELIYNNEVAKYVEELGYNTILAEGAEKVLGWRSPNFVYRPHGCSKIKLLLRNYRLTDDVAFRFSNKGWSEYPLYAEKYTQWLHAQHGEAEIINLFMDYETFGEHHWEDTGIFAFLEKLPEYVLQHPEFSFVNPHEISASCKPVGELDVPEYVSWADMERDLTAWYGNDLQNDAFKAVYALEKEVKSVNDSYMLHMWRLLQTSDHYYYMCTKYASDGDVHKYFNPYHNPYDAYINFQNVLADFTIELAKKKEYAGDSIAVRELMLKTEKIIEKVSCCKKLGRKLRNLFATAKV